MGFKKMQTLTHDMENLFSEVRNDTIKVNSTLVDIMFDCLDAIEGYLETVKATSDEGSEDNAALIQRINDFVAAGGGDAARVEKLRTFALNLGLAFQYEDDLLDGDSPFPKEKTESLVHETTAAAIAALAGLPGDTSFLKALAEKLVNRKV